jgi:geranylgeranyl diphosphate synthase type II
MTAFKRYFDAQKKEIDSALLKYLRRYCSKENPVYAKLVYSMFPGGKRIRPVLCLEACLVCGGSIDEAMVPACALEFLHNYSLIHDDLPAMDNDDYRRGKLTCHKKFGEAGAILAGDALLTMAFEVMQDIEGHRVLRDIMKTVASAAGAKGMIGGQLLDVKYAGKNKSQAVRRKINSLKTGELFYASLKCGALIAEAADRQMLAIERFGRLFGEAFQIMDDLDDGEYNKGALKRRKNELALVIASAKRKLDIFGERAHNLIYLIDTLKK